MMKSSTTIGSISAMFWSIVGSLLMLLNSSLLSFSDVENFQIVQPRLVEVGSVVQLFAYSRQESMRFNWYDDSTSNSTVAVGGFTTWDMHSDSLVVYCSAEIGENRSARRRVSVKSVTWKAGPRVFAPELMSSCWGNEFALNGYVWQPISVESRGDIAYYWIDMSTGKLASSGVILGLPENVGGPCPLVCRPLKDRQYKLIVVDGLGYAGMDSTHVKVVELPFSKISAELKATCLDDIQSFTAKETVGHDYSWSVTNSAGTIITGVDSSTMTILWTRTGIHHVVLRETNGNCSSEMSYPVNVTTLNEPTIVGMHDIAVGEELTVAVPEEKSTYYEWFADSAEVMRRTPTTLTVRFTTPGRKKISLRATSKGCSKSFDAYVNVRSSSVDQSQELIECRRSGLGTGTIVRSLAAGTIEVQHYSYCGEFLRRIEIEERETVEVESIGSVSVLIARSQTGLRQMFVVDK